MNSATLLRSSTAARLQLPVDRSYSRLVGNGRHHCAIQGNGAMTAIERGVLELLKSCEFLGGPL